MNSKEAALKRKLINRPKELVLFDLKKAQDLVINSKALKEYFHKCIERIPDLVTTISDSTATTYYRIICRLFRHLLKHGQNKVDKSLVISYIKIHPSNQIASIGTRLLKIAGINLQDSEKDDLYHSKQTKKMKIEHQKFTQLLRKLLDDLKLKQNQKNLVYNGLQFSQIQKLELQDIILRQFNHLSNFEQFQISVSDLTVELSNLIITKQQGRNKDLLINRNLTFEIFEEELQQTVQEICEQDIQDDLYKVFLQKVSLHRQRTTKGQKTNHVNIHKTSGQILAPNNDSSESEKDLSKSSSQQDYSNLLDSEFYSYPQQQDIKMQSSSLCNLNNNKQERLNKSQANCGSELILNDKVETKQDLQKQQALNGGSAVCKKGKKLARQTSLDQITLQPQEAKEKICPS